MMKIMLKEGHKAGMDLPDDLKDILKGKPEIASQLSIDNKMSRREKLKAQKKFDERADQEFFERTGIRNEGLDMNMGQLIKTYEYDMAKMNSEAQKKSSNIAKRKQFIKYTDIDPHTGKPK